MRDAETINELAARVGRVRHTVWRWIRAGVSVNGRTVRLGARRLGGRWVIRRCDWELFELLTNPEAAGQAPRPVSRSGEVAIRDLSKLLGV